MTTATITLPMPRHATPFARRLVLSTGLALIMWASRRPARPSHEQHALRLAAQATTERQRDSVTRYGFVQ
jgi:hypothetical protein